MLRNKIVATGLLAAGILAAGLSSIVDAQAQSAIIRGQISPGVYENLVTDGSGHLVVTAPASGTSVADPCLDESVAKSNVAINVTTATTIALVTPSGTTKIYICSFSVTVSQVTITPNTFKFVYGTGVACVTSPQNLTGIFGDGGITAALPLFVSGGFGTILTTPASQGFCITTTIGASGSFQGYLTYVQL